MGADYSFYEKFIATKAPTFFGHIISVLASVLKTTVPALMMSLVQASDLSGHYFASYSFEHLNPYLIKHSYFYAPVL